MEVMFGTADGNYDDYCEEGIRKRRPSQRALFHA